MIRVLHIHTLPVVSGSGINTFLSMRLLDRERFEPVMACAPGGPLQDLVEGEGMEFLPFPALVQPVAPLTDLRAVRDLAVYLRHNRFDVVHTHNSKAGFIGRLAARLAKVPVVVHTVHGFSFHDSEPALRRALFKTLERIAARWCDHMIYISRPLVAWARREGISPPGGEDAQSVIYSGIELERFSPVPEAERAGLRAQWGIEPDAPVVGMVSKLWEGKGHEVLLEAFAQVVERLPAARLVIVGEGALRLPLEKRARELGVAGSVVFTGFQGDVAPFNALFDVAVLPSFFEGMGRVLLEAMAMERPVVASDVGGIPDVVEHGTTGLLVPVGSSEELTFAILSILENKDMARAMGRAGRARITEIFSAQSMAGSIQSLYENLLARKGVTT